MRSPPRTLTMELYSDRTKSMARGPALPNFLILPAMQDDFCGSAGHWIYDMDWNEERTRNHP